MKTLLFCALSAVSLGAAAAPPAAKATGEIRERYLEDRAHCNDRAVEDRQACLREAGAAQYEARRGTLGQENTEFEKNRFARCEYHKVAEDREYCQRRMRGEGTVTGSVEGGGLLRELIVIVPAEEQRPATR
jgi:hypothetical protein